MIRLSYFPSKWKVAKIIMLAKPNKPENDASSYRPISLLSIFSKIFERIFLGRIHPILEDHNIIPDHQFGFRSHHGAPEQCHRVINVIREALEKKKYCSGVFLDVKQAFDRVWHEGLLYKLKKLLPMNYYLLLQSFLYHRKFFVQVSDECSEQYEIFSGVPQGSVLGPVLYTVYTSDIPTFINGTIATYADDTVLLTSSTSPVEASELMQSQLDKVLSWLNNWKIEINANKSTHVTFALRKGDCPAVILNGTPIPQNNKAKYLGFHLDRRLTWKNHIRIKKKQVNDRAKKMYWLIGHKSEMSLYNKVLLYKTMIKPIWTWGIQLWGTCSKSNINILQRSQSKILRLLCGAPWYISNDAIHRDLKVPKVTEEIKRFSERYLNRLDNHVNPLAINLLDNSQEIKRLKRKNVLDLPFL